MFGVQFPPRRSKDAERFVGVNVPIQQTGFGLESEGEPRCTLIRWKQHKRRPSKR